MRLPVVALLMHIVQISDNCLPKVHRENYESLTVEGGNFYPSQFSFQLRSCARAIFKKEMERCCIQKCNTTIYVIYMLYTDSVITKELSAGCWRNHLLKETSEHC